MKPPGSDAALADWLAWIEATHPNEIEMGLERARTVAVRAQLLPAGVPIITVAGTNGKGSTVAMLSAIYQAAGYRTGVYTSPHIERFNERIVVDGIEVANEALVASLSQIEASRAGVALTYFEFSTLAAMQVFLERECEVIILEVGLGGRLDTTNVWDADCAIVTSIAIDHEAWLGRDRERIGFEKVGIGRANRPLIMGEQDPPPRVLQDAIAAGMQLQRVPPENERETLELALPGAHQQSNAHAALLAVATLQNTLPLPLDTAKKALSTVQLAGRFEQHRVQGIDVVLDVAHNPAAAASVAAALQQQYPQRPVYALFGALDDKDVGGIVEALQTVVRAWYCITLHGARARSSRQLCDLVSVNGATATAHSDIAEAWFAAYQDVSAYNSKHSHPEALVLVAGSFHTLAAWHEHWQNVGSQR